MKIAIVGSGIAGLTTAHLLSKRGCEVHLFESQSRIGMSAHSLEFPSPVDGRLMPGDVPSRMFNAKLWPRVVELYQSLGIEIKAVESRQSYRVGPLGEPLVLDFPFRFSSEILGLAGAAVSQVASSLGLKGPELKGSAVNGAKDTVPSLKDRRIKFLSEIRRLREQGVRDLESLDPELSFVDYLQRHKFSEEFRSAFLYPALSSTVCTCSHAAISQYPAVILLRAMKHISGDDRLSRVVGGAKVVAQRLVANAAEVRLGTPVASLDVQGDQVCLKTVAGQAENYDHVVIATQANQVEKVFPGISSSDRSVLNAFRYEDVEVVVHTDESFMPAAMEDWSVFNFEGDQRNEESMCTVWMNRFHDDWKNAGFDQPMFQTIRPTREVAADSLVQRIALQRPVVDHGSWRLWRELRQMVGESKGAGRRVWFSGSYAIPGIPLLESAVESALEVVDSITQKDGVI